MSMMAADAMKAADAMQAADAMNAAAVMKAADMLKAADAMKAAEAMQAMALAGLRLRATMAAGWRQLRWWRGGRHARTNRFNISLTAP